MDIEIGTTVRILHGRRGTGTVVGINMPTATNKTHQPSEATYDIRLIDGHLITEIYRSTLSVVPSYSIDRLIDENGNWQLHYRFNRYGCNFLLLLPNFAVDAKESIRNQAILDMCEMDFEENLVISRFADASNTPFISFSDTLSEAIDTMNRKLGAHSEETFRAKVEEFNKFLELCEIITNDRGGPGLVMVAVNDWKTAIDSTK